jgi:hypothetical protein
VTIKAGTTARVQLVVERQGGEISGRVVDQGGKPVTDAFIDAVRGHEGAAAPSSGPMAMPSMGPWSNAPVLTDPEGEFVIGNLSQGVYTVRAHRRGGGSGSVEQVKVGATVTITIQQTGSIAGTLSAPGGGPPDQFTIRLVNHAAPFFRHESFLFTGGAFSISDLPEGKYELSVEAAEGTASAEITLASGEQRTGVALMLSGRAAVKGQVVSLEDGAPMVGVSLQAIPRSGMGGPGPMMESNVTDNTGHFELTQVPAGAVMLMAMPADPMTSERDPAAVPVDVLPGAVTDVGRILVAKRRLKMGDMPGDLGFSLKQPTSPADMFTRSLEVSEVRPDGPAAAAGLRVGDMIVSVDGYDVSGKMGYLFGTLSTVREGTRVTFGVARGASIAIVAAKMSVDPNMPHPGAPYPGAPPPEAPPPPPPP